MADDKKQDFETALREFELAANNFAIRFIKMAEVRAWYRDQAQEMSRSLRAAVESGEISAQRGAELAHGARNEILDMARRRDFDLGRSIAEAMKKNGISFEEAIKRALKNLKLDGQPFEKLSGADQRRVLIEVIESAGRPRPRANAWIPRLRWTSRGLWLATILIAGYNIGTAENPWWQTGREAANIAGGVGGGFAGGAAMGAAAGIWGGPVGVAIGVLVGGALGALLADHAYVEAAGTSDPLTRGFVARFTSFWSGVDEDGMAKALATEYRTNAAFALRVFGSLNADYASDADDVALAYVNYARRDAQLKATIASNRALRDFLIKVMSEGWTSSDEQLAINFLRAL